VTIDGLGAGLLGLSMVGFIYGLIEGSTDGWTNGPLLSLVAGAVAFLLFAARQRTASNPLVLPSLLANKGFTSGLVLGLAYFAAVNGFAYVVSLFFQVNLRLTTSQAALGLAPMMVGIIIASFLARPWIPRLGRDLVVAALVVSFAGAVAIFATVVVAGGAVGVLQTAPGLFIFGLGMGTYFSSIYDVAIGDVAQAETGSASGAFSAVQQLANALGAAVVTTVYFKQVAYGGIHAVTVSVAVVGAVVLICLGLVWLLPKQPPAESRESA
jgi:Na+/melibiose symporter-like transporter